MTRPKRATDLRVPAPHRALEAIAPVHKEQLLTYLKLTEKRLGLLYFNVA